ncbi:MAG TPA: sodium/glutamate symporter [Paenalcaligenes sp.]|nr:sodium/glutamate symporter [Paenalcaligenes sp.]
MLIEFSNVETLGLAAIFLVIGHFIKERIPVLERYFIPSPIIGGLVFSIIMLIGHQTGAFNLELSNDMRDLLLMMFFTTIGFTASLEMLKRGGVAVALFLLACTILVLIQNIVGAGLATILGTNPLIGLAAGSISLTGGHGTSAAFGPLLEAHGAVGALPAAIAAATWGLVLGCIIGGPVGLRLLRRYHLKGPQADASGMGEASADNDAKRADPTRQSDEEAAAKEATRRFPFSTLSVVLLCVAAGLGGAAIDWLQQYGVTVPAYLGAMLIAALIRNIYDLRRIDFPDVEMNTISMVSLSFFLVLALMSMRLWELAHVFGPLLIILIVQTVIVFFFTYFVTFRIMGKDYDAATLAVGHCGVGLGATPNAMANIQAFTNANGPSPKAFFVIPIVGSLFIDFVNAIVITVFVNVFS